jgi:hypothetical protein
LERALRDWLSPEDQQRMSWLHYGQHTSTATLVRGEDRPHHFAHELRPDTDMSKAVLAWAPRPAPAAGTQIEGSAVCDGEVVEAGTALITVAPDGTVDGA